MHYDPDISAQSVNSRYAAAFLGIAENTLRRLRQAGAVPAFQMPSGMPGAKSVWRYPLADLYKFVEANGSYSHLSNPRFRCGFPVNAIADLLGVSAQDVRIQKYRGRLKGYDPVSVRNYLIRVSRISLVAEIRREFDSKVSRLHQEVRRLRRQLKLSKSQGYEGSL